MLRTLDRFGATTSSVHAKRRVAFGKRLACVVTRRTAFDPRAVASETSPLTALNGRRDPFRHTQGMLQLP